MIRFSKRSAAARAFCLGVTGLAAVSAYRDAGAYEQSTHQIMTARGKEQSTALADPANGVLFDLDVPPAARFPDHEEIQRTVNELLWTGAHFEDEGSRSIYHFFGPQHGGRGLTIEGVTASSSIGWMLNDVGSIVNLPWPLSLLADPPDVNDYSYPDARRYFLRSMSLGTRPERDVEMGKLFQSLGHIVHHIQDMAQPDHTRNDPHLIVVDTSPHHTWTAQQNMTLPLEGYPPLAIGQLTRMEQLWSDGGRGMADFSSRNFVSEDTNYVGRLPHLASRIDVPSPNPSNSTVEHTTLVDLLGYQPEDLPNADIWFIGNQVTDWLNPSLSTFNQRGSTFSIFSNDLQGVGGLETSMNKFNFAANNEFLLPRAVAYTAAAYDFFFRARLDIESIELDQLTVTLTVRNASVEGVNLSGQQQGQGDGFEWALYYDTTDETRERLPLTNDDLGGTVLESGDTVELSFPIPENFDASLNKPFMLVFNGTAGAEPAIAGKAFSAIPLTGFLVRPGFTPNDGYAGKRQLNRVGSTWVAKRSDAFAGNVDWKGQIASDTLTWVGPPSRYFYADDPTGYSRLIYKGGALLTQAPANVQGVAINRTGEPRLLVVTYQSQSLRVYTRPLRDQYENDAAYDAVNNPDGWRLLYSAAEALPFTPTFFNASGTEAQLITSAGTNSVAGRVKLSIAGDVVTRTSVSAIGSGTGRNLYVITYGAGAHSASPGHPVPDPNFPQSCAWGTDCTQEIQCGSNPAFCAVNELNSTDTGSMAEEMHSGVTFDNSRTAICVDYIGDAEVLCEIAYRNDAITVGSSTTTQSRQFDVRSEFTCDTHVGTEMHTVEQSQHHGESSNGMVRTLRIGDLEVPLFGSALDTTLDWSTELVQENFTIPSMSGNVTEVKTSWTVSSRVLYVDARNATVVYETNESHRVVDQRGSNPVWQAGPIEFTWSTTQSTVTESSNRETVAHIRGQRISMAQESPEPVESPGDTITLPPPSRASDSVVHSCSGEPREDVLNDQQTPFTDTLDWRAIIHPAANHVTQGYAVDRDGNYVISQPLWEPFNGGVIRVGTWTGVSNGNIGTLVPGASQGSIFNEVKLLQ